MKHCFRILFFLIASLLLLPITRLWAQGGVSSSGTDYWLQFMPNGAGAGTTQVYENLFIASGTDNKVTISGPINYTFTMSAGQVHDIPLTDVMNSVDEVPQADAIHVTSTNPIVIYGYSAWGNSQGIGDSPDGFLALPTTAYGREYYTVNFPDNYVFGQMPGEFLITSPYDNNNITITPAAVTKGGKQANVPFNITLQKGETYLVQSPGTNFGENDLTGSLIVSSEPVSVLTGHQISSVPTDYGFSADNLFEMIPSVDRWGTQYFDEPMAGKIIAGDYLRVLSAENGNEITYNGNGPLILDSGQYSDITQQTIPMVLTSINHKRFIVAQYSYSQGYDGDPGQSDPWMVLFTPQEQFEKEMIFRTPTSVKGAFTNYVTFISREDSISKITINGLPIGAFPSVGNATFPGTNPLMGARRIIVGPSAKNYIATGPEPFGSYQYGFSNYEGYGWPTGMAQRLITGDTLPPLAKTLDSSCGTFHILYTEPRLKTNGFSFNDSRIASISMITAASDPRWAKPSFNYTFIPDSKFQIGDASYLATLTVNNPAQDAYAEIYAVDLAGNDTVYQYYYYAPKITFSPASPYDFGAVLDGADSCRTITITNVQPGGEFMAEFDSIGGFATGGSFTVTPTTLAPLADSASITLHVCFHPTDTGVASVDSLYLISQCVSYVMPLTGTGITPLIYVTDLAFGELDSGKTNCLPLTIYNRGKAPLTITAQDLAVSDPNFSIDPNQKFPVVIQPGQSTKISYCFHPQSWGNFSDSVNFLNLNPTEFQRSIKDYALLTGIALPAGAVLTSYAKDFTVSCNDTILYDTLYDNLPTSKSIDTVELVGPDASFFTILGNQPYPYLLKGDSTPPFLYFQIQFNPTKNGLDLTPRTVTLQSHAAGGGPQPALTIQAQLVTPIAQIAPNFIDLGTSRINQPTLPKTFTITNSGNAPLVINSFNPGGADAGSFSFSPAPPFTIAAGDSLVDTVTAMGSETRSYSGNGSIEASCNSVAFSYQAAFSSVGDVPQGTIHPKTYVGGCRTNTQYATFKNENSQDSITITDLSIAGANPNDFSLAVASQSVVVGPGQTDSIPIIFLPTATGPRSGTLVFSLKGNGYRGTDSTWTETAELIGTGVSVSRQVGIGSVTAAPQYHSMAGNGVSIPIVVNTPIDVNAPDNGTTEAYGYRFDVSWKRDAFQYVSTNPAAVSVVTQPYNAATGMETRVFTFESAAPLTGVDTLATFNVLSMLTTSDTTGIQLSNVQWLDKDTIPLCYVSDTSFNGTHVLDPVCGSTTLQNFLLKGAISVDAIRPNPAGASAEIDYSLASARPISVSIFDLLGNEVKRLRDSEPQTEGAHALQFTSDGLASGTYYCRITDGHFVVSRQFEIAK